MRESASGSAASAVAENGTNALNDERTPLLKSTSQSQNQDSEPPSEAQGDGPDRGLPAGQEEETTTFKTQFGTILGHLSRSRSNRKIRVSKNPKTIVV